MKKFLIVVGSLLILAGFLTYQLMGLAQKKCSLCITFQGARKCTTALGPNDEQAQEEAHRNACAILASGVTEVVACTRAQREEIFCEHSQ